MLTNAKIDELFGIKESYQAPDVLMKVLFNKEAREELFKKFLEHEVNLDNDWFHIYFEEEHSNKAKLNQDFTPMAVASVLSQLAGNGPGMNLDVAAGSGGITIKKWVDDKMAIGFFEYRPSLCFYQYKRVFNSTVNYFLKRKCEEAGVTVITVHALRHTHASILLNAGVTIHSIADRLGHSSVSTTQETYTHIIDELASKDNQVMIGALTAIG